MPIRGLDAESTRKCLRFGYLKQDLIEAARIVGPVGVEILLPAGVNLAAATRCGQLGFFLLANPLEIMIRKKRRRPLSRSQNDCPWKPCR
jgi:hypothetical protein